MWQFQGDEDVVLKSGHPILGLDFVYHRLGSWSAFSLWYAERRAFIGQQFSAERREVWVVSANVGEEDERLVSNTEWDGGMASRCVCTRVPLDGVKCVIIRVY